MLLALILMSLEMQVMRRTVGLNHPVFEPSPLHGYCRGWRFVPGFCKRQEQGTNPNGDEKTMLPEEVQKTAQLQACIHFLCSILVSE